MAKVEKVPAQYVARVWPLLERFVADVEPHVHGEWTVAQMKADVMQGRTLMVSVVEDGACIGVVLYKVYNSRNGRTVFIEVCSGSGLTTEENWKQLKDIFLREGATDIEAAMRPAVARLWSQLGFTGSQE